ncbi:MAG: protein translocase subunit SecD [Acidimicrobiales bacterium]
MQRRLAVSLAAFVLVSIASLVGVNVAGWSPQLGLDLQGGTSVVLQPRDPVTDPEILEQAIAIIRSRVDALGVAEPEITQQGTSIIVAIPGLADREQALKVVGQTARLFFRPVIEVLPAEAEPDPEATTTTVPPADPAAAPTTAPPDEIPQGAEPAEGEESPEAEESPEGEEPAEAAAPDVNSTTPPSENEPEKEVILPERDDEGKVLARYRLGPAAVTGDGLSSARATVDPVNGTWAVDFELTSEGSVAWDEMAKAVGIGGRIAIDLDGQIESAPSLSSTEFGGSGQITGDFDEEEAKSLALVLRYGSLPVQLDRQTVENVSASLGRDSLSAGLMAGFLGLGLVALYMAFYYRILGVVVWLGLSLSGALMYSIVSLLGAKTGLALTLAGAVGIIVSVGVTVDSYVVFFERLKDELRAGRTLRSSVDRGFSRAYRTILTADAASLIGAAVLYWLSVGSVRGFAFFLGLSAILDIVVAYMFTRPVVILASRSTALGGSGWMGVGSALAPDPAATPVAAAGKARR